MEFKNLYAYYSNHVHGTYYCTILINSSVTRHVPSKINEISRLSQSFWRSDEIILGSTKPLPRIPNINLENRAKSSTERERGL
jgi:hypothetical protein